MTFKVGTIPIVLRRAAALAVGLLLLLAIGRAQRAAVELGPQQQVVTANAKMGVHTRLTDEVEPWKIQRTFEMVREMGAPWVGGVLPVGGA